MMVWVVETETTDTRQATRTYTQTKALTNLQYEDTHDGVGGGDSHR